MNTLIVNVIVSTIIFNFAYRWFLKPRLPNLRAEIVLVPMLLLHSLRHIGLMFITTGVTSPNMPQQFAVPAAAGDFLAGMLALTTAILIQRKNRFAIPMAWVFTVVGLVDFISAITLSRLYSAGDFLGGAYWIPAFWVPLLFVAHLAIIDVLLLNKRRQSSFSGA